eukprot:12465429-Ditylum_brightwellii.AAC.1
MSNDPSADSLTTSPKTSWLVHMLRTEYKPINKIAVDYLELLSNLTVIDYILDEGVSPTPADFDSFHQSQKQIFSEVEHLHSLVTAMLMLEDNEKERAAVTLIIQQVLNNAVVRPF